MYYHRVSFFVASKSILDLNLRLVKLGRVPIRESILATLLSLLVSFFLQPDYGSRLDLQRQVLAKECQSISIMPVSKSLDEAKLAENRKRIDDLDRYEAKRQKQALERVIKMRELLRKPLKNRMPKDLRQTAIPRDCIKQQVPKSENSIAKRLKQPKTPTVCQFVFRRCRRASNISSAAETDAFRLSAEPHIGI